MRVIGEIRRLRLLQLKSDLELSFADMSEKLGRDRRDATLSQVASGQANTRSGKPRLMGDDQARAIEAAFGKEPGWLDRDPDFEKLLAGDTTELVAHETDGPGYSLWPFKRLPASRVQNLQEPARVALEDMMLAAVEMAERLSSVLHRAQPPPLKSARIYAFPTRAKRKAPP